MVFYLCFRTKIVELGLVEKSLDSNWDEAPKEIHSAYGQKYVDDCKVQLN
jgi:hypothetical protein